MLQTLRNHPSEALWTFSLTVFTLLAIALTVLYAYRQETPVPFKYRFGDRVMVAKNEWPGRWRVHAPAPGTGNYWLRPDDDVSRALAALQTYGMITVHVASLIDAPRGTR